MAAGRLSQNDLPSVSTQHTSRPRSRRNPWGIARCWSSGGHARSDTATPRAPERSGPNPSGRVDLTGTGDDPFETEGSYSLRGDDPTDFPTDWSIGFLSLRSTRTEIESVLGPPDSVDEVANGGPSSSWDLSGGAELEVGGLSQDPDAVVYVRADIPESSPVRVALAGEVVFGTASFDDLIEAWGEPAVHPRHVMEQEVGGRRRAGGRALRREQLVKPTEEPFVDADQSPVGHSGAMDRSSSPRRRPVSMIRFRNSSGSPSRSWTMRSSKAAAR